MFFLVFHLSIISNTLKNAFGSLTSGVGFQIWTGHSSPKCLTVHSGNEQLNGGQKMNHIIDKVWMSMIWFDEWIAYWLWLSNLTQCMRFRTSTVEPAQSHSITPRSTTYSTCHYLHSSNHIQSQISKSTKIAKYKLKLLRLYNAQRHKYGKAG